nr:MAG TPA: hypothetical protein [Caudoviricetes sp.]
MRKTQHCISAMSILYSLIERTSFEYNFSI